MNPGDAIAKWEYVHLPHFKLYLKLGRKDESETSPTYSLEILDYVGNISILTDSFRLDDKIYCRIGYGVKVEQITQNTFYEKLADEIMKFIIRLNFKQTEEYEFLTFNATPERRALYSKLKIPLIIKETII